MRTIDIEKIVRGVIALSLCMPLVFVPSSFIFPFIVPKLLFFRTCIFVAFGGYLLLLAADWKRYQPLRDPITLVVFLFLFSFGVSSFAGVDWYRSVWDTHERMLGFFTLFHYGLFFLVLTRVVNNWKEWKFLFRIFLIVGGIIMLIGAWQKFVDPDILLNRGNQQRVSATLGNPIYFSGLGLFVAAIAAVLSRFEKKKTFWWWISMIGFLLGTGGVLWGGTRGSLVGYIAAIFLSLLVLLFSKQVAKETRKKISIVLIGLMMVVVALFGLRNTPPISSISTISRITNINYENLSKNTRVMAWSIAGEAWIDKPLFGWGPNNYYYAFNEHYNPVFYRYGVAETWFDNAHSALINTLAVQGIVGLLLYLGLFGSALYGLYKGYKQNTFRGDVAIVVFAFLVGHFVHNIFVFENPTSYLYFFFMLAFIAQQGFGESGLKNKNTQMVPSSTIGIVLCAVLLFVYVTNVNPARANTAALQMVMSAQKSPDQSLDLFEAATAISSPHIDDIRADFSRTAAATASRLAQIGEGEKALELLNVGILASEKNIELHPKDVRYHLTLSQIYETKALLINDQSYVEMARDVLEEALFISPNRQQLMYHLANVYQKLGDDVKAEETYRAAIDTYDRIGESWWRLALFHKQQGDLDKAEEILDQAVDAGARFTKQDTRIIDKQFNFSQKEQEGATETVSE